MAYIATHTAPSTGHSAVFRMFAAIGAAVLRYGEVRSHYREIAALQFKSDAELAEMGLTRDGIIRHIYSDSFYL